MITIFPALPISMRAICTPAAVTALTALVSLAAGRWTVRATWLGRPLGQNGQKGQKRGQSHDTHALSDLSDLSDAGAPEKSSGLTCHRWMERPSVLVVTSFSQPAPTKPSTTVRVL